MDDATQIPPRVLELVAAATGQTLATVTHAAPAESDGGPQPWDVAAERAVRQAGLKAARFTVETEEELSRLCSLEAPAFTSVGDRWYVLLGARRGALDLVVLDGRSERRQRMRPAAFMAGLKPRGSSEPAPPWLAIEPRLMLSEMSHPPSEFVRLVRAFVMERREVFVVCVYGAVMAAVSLAVPVAAQALVNTISSTLMLQPILLLSTMLLVALAAVALLRVLQFIAVERVYRQLWVRGVTDWIRRTARTSRKSRQTVSNRELCNRYMDMPILQKDFSSLLLDGTSLVMVSAASLVLLAFYHPLLLAFDAALIVCIAGVMLAGRGAEQRAIHESDCKWWLFRWMDDVASMRLVFSDPRGRALADAHGEVLLRNWLQARGRYFDTLLRHIVTGAALEVLATVGVLAIGGWLVISRELTLGQLVAASVLVSQVGAGVRGLGQQLDPVYEGVAAVQTLALTLDADLEPRGGELLPTAARPMAVELTSEPSNLTIRPGERVALVGGNDGHSRVLDLLYGLYDRTPPLTLTGRLDGRDVRYLELDSIREQVALVRGGELVGASLLENLVGAGWSGDRAELHALLDLVDLRRTALGLPGGFDQLLLGDGDGGLLTDSEIRRVALVRALVAQPRLLLIDLGLDRLDLSAPQRTALLDWIFDRARPWTLIVVTDSLESDEVLARCDRQLVLYNNNA
ncbi:ABC-type bacteriocin/lantibiotic exporter, contains an N-terminal double-glycine peptidase domain [Nannocystis exedens]|uniref:ABC-type bacteriocin/lantibiotic exporter, contains an N-terminal double-glycine peptidase domain n=1 Tax=Nannocystis exedens TaxID=54 RepID=A0A1I2C016_9BACT|nr:ATP-binding cassette domain-containing protein [Nannocystis exedens]PCC71159.1 Heterocyst differentiation ATP-binding protein HepA [Nannocystis exedens]SFE61595.1 ABC-type bacteriocin/lantibiotic exporter, contains an N-terminal double-glycine peptidase domain [Nannocystis exedens]